MRLAEWSARRSADVAASRARTGAAAGSTPSSPSGSSRRQRRAAIFGSAGGIIRSCGPAIGFRVDFLAKFQWDAMRPGDDPSDFDEYQIHRARIGIEGEVFRYMQFSVEGEMTEREADVRSRRGIRRGRTSTSKRTSLTPRRYEFGRFKIPFGLNRTSGS